MLKTYLCVRPFHKKLENTLPYYHCRLKYFIIIQVYRLRFCAGETEYGRQHIGLYYSHKYAHADGGGNSSVHFGGVDTDHMVESCVEGLLQVKGSQQHCKHRRCSRYRRVQL